MFVFENDKLTKLKTKAAADSGVEKPSRVEVVTALLYKCAVASSTASSGSFKPSSLGIATDLRQFLSSSTTQEDYPVGNFASEFTILTYDSAAVSFSQLVKEIRRRKKQMFASYQGLDPDAIISCILSEAEQFSNLVVSGNNMEGYICSSLCNLSNLTIDFGYATNFFLLMDSVPMDGIQALVSLDEKVMTVFQNDPELLAFATLQSSKTHQDVKVV